MNKYGVIDQLTFMFESVERLLHIYFSPMKTQKVTKTAPK